MKLTRDMLDLIDLFNRHNVEYMLVGGVAVACHGYVRTTQDIDFLVFPSEANAEKVMAALTDFGFGNAGIPKECFARESTAVHIGVEPNRIDFLTSLDGVSNETLFKNKERISLEGRELRVISMRDLIKVKKKSARLKDLADADELEKISRSQ